MIHFPKVIRLNTQKPYCRSRKNIDFLFPKPYYLIKSIGLILLSTTFGGGN